VSSDPVGGTRVDEGTAVNLVIGTGPDAITVPNVIGLLEQEARDNLANAGFTGSISIREVDSLEEEGRVISVSPDQQTQADPSTPITLELSRGTIELPDVQGQPEAEARRLIVEAGFSEGQIVTQNVERDDVAQGTVAESSPGPGSAVGSGQEITLLVAVPVPPEPIPTTAPPTTVAPTPPTATPTTVSPPS
jgi:serine/threonine-protein kinase